MEYRKQSNQTTRKEFILLGLTDEPRQQIALFWLFLAIYMIAVGGNAVISILVLSDSKLHTPMYFFLVNLSILDICMTTVIVPKMLYCLITGEKTISFHVCIVQLYCFAFLVSTEFFLLAVMAIDRYVAICHPFRYANFMSTRICTTLAASSWGFSFFHSLLHTVLISNLSFCGPYQLQQFFCDIPPLLKLSCSDTTTNELLILTESSLCTLVAVMTVIVSYVRIIYTILNMATKEGRRRAFSTCVSHLTVVTLYYGTLVFNYIRPTSSYSLKKDKVMTVMYTIVAPMVNPFIYSLRNKQVKEALRSQFHKLQRQR
ncbi:olfactory receptor 5V1-like [Pleurodeles waltl]|uniref:olfactory receptor 5V1-like n=1 Tax=Pleurodeles waltl TaxID=8319 RepID=UPI0037097FA8